MPVNDGPEEYFWLLPESADIEHLTMLQVDRYLRGRAIAVKFEIMDKRG